jgi:23S rRNA pseudouridine1911/1915/1917 synthase
VRPLDSDPNGAPEDWRELAITADLHGQRLDQALAALFPEQSRNRLQSWLKKGRVLLDGASAAAKKKVAAGQSLRVLVETDTEVLAEPQAMALDIRYQDEDILVLNKPAGLVVHPAPGNRDGTLVNGLLHLLPEQAQLPRAGIVHRLDMDTSGLMVVAKSALAHKQLVAALQRREIRRQYLALVHGVMTAGGEVDAPIGRHPRVRVKMAVVASGREALTLYRIHSRYPAHTLLDVTLASGRTHQIRVHMAHIRHPLVGDPVYGTRPRPPKGASAQLLERLHALQRQALHAQRLGLNHPRSGVALEWQVEPPDDLAQLIAALDQEQT